jgi:hypothetical protein
MQPWSTLLLFFSFFSIIHHYYVNVKFKMN